LRKSRNLTQEQLAEIFGINRENISKWENGIAEPNRENLIKVADYFKVSIDYLLNRPPLPHQSQFTPAAE
jgi:transcriptional regulator with XRE-family HTH domain